MDPAITPSEVRSGRIHVARPIIERVRLTIPAREALLAGGCEMVGSAIDDLHRYYDIALERPPRGLVYVLIDGPPRQHHALRLDVEPAYPGEWPRGGVQWWEAAALLPCPTCGRGLYCTHSEALASGFCPDCEQTVNLLPVAEKSPDECSICRGRREPMTGPTRPADAAADLTRAELAYWSGLGMGAPTIEDAARLTKLRAARAAYKAAEGVSARAFAWEFLAGGAA